LRPSIEISGAEKVNVEFFPLRANWNVAPNGRAGVVVWVTNNVASIGQKTVIATNLAVTVRFEDFNGRTFHRVSRAYWLNHSGNEIDLGIGERAGILIGTVGNDRWATYDNSRREEYQVGRKMPRSILPSASPQELCISDFRVEVTLFNTDDGTTHQVIWFRLKLSEDGDSIDVASYK